MMQFVDDKFNKKNNESFGLLSESADDNDFDQRRERQKIKDKEENLFMTPVKSSGDDTYLMTKYDEDEEDDNCNRSMLFTGNYEEDEDFEGIDEATIIENCIVEQLTGYISELNDRDFREFVTSEEFDILSEAGIFTKNTIISLNKNDELKKRTSIYAIEIEKNKNSSLYKQYEKHRKAFLDAKKDIINKNKKVAEKLAAKQLRVFQKSIDTKKIPTTVRVLDNKKK